MTEWPRSARAKRARTGTVTPRPRTASVIPTRRPPEIPDRGPVILNATIAEGVRVLDPPAVALFLLMIQEAQADDPEWSAGLDEFMHWGHVKLDEYMRKGLDDRTVLPAGWRWGEGNNKVQNPARWMAHDASRAGSGVRAETAEQVIHLAWRSLDRRRRMESPRMGQGRALGLALEQGRRGLDELRREFERVSAPHATGFRSADEIRHPGETDDEFRTRLQSILDLPPPIQRARGDLAIDEDGEIAIDRSNDSLMQHVRDRILGRDELATSARQIGVPINILRESRELLEQHGHAGGIWRRDGETEAQYRERLTEYHQGVADARLEVMVPGVAATEGQRRRIREYIEREAPNLMRPSVIIEADDEPADPGALQPGDRIMVANTMIRESGLPMIELEVDRGGQIIRLDPVPVGTHTIDTVISGHE